MSKKLDDLDLIAIRELGKSSQKVQDLINDKNIEIQDIELGQKTNFKKLEPAPKPKGDIRITKRYTKEIRSIEETKKEIERIELIYADRIKPAMEEKAIQTDQDHLLPTLNKIEKNNLPILLENGLDAYKKIQVEKQIEIEQALDFDLDDTSKFEDYPIYLDFDKNGKDVEKAPNPSDDFE